MNNKGESMNILIVSENFLNGGVRNPNKFNC